MAERLRSLAQRYGGVRGFAEKVAISASLVSSYLNGKRLPDALTLRKIVEHTGVSLDWLFFGDGGNSLVLRGQSRPEATLAQDVAEHVGREALRLVGGSVLSVDGELPLSVSVDGERLLSAAAHQVARNYRGWAERMQAVRDAFMPVAEVESGDPTARDVFDRALAAGLRLTETSDASLPLSVDPGAYIPLPPEVLREVAPRAMARLYER